MTDDLDDLQDLKAAMRAASPAPDAARKARNLALAEKNYAELQGSRVGARPNSERPVSGLWRGIRSMLNVVSSRGGLIGTTALIAVTFVAFGPISELAMPPAPSPQPLFVTEEAAAVPAVPAVPAAPERAKAVTGGSNGLADLVAPSSAFSGLAEQSQMQAAPTSRRALSPGVGTLQVMSDEAAPRPAQSNTEAFANADPNPIHVTAEDPVSTFSIDVDTASYSVVRNALMHGRLPTPESVRIEEMVNYFNYGYPGPDAQGDAPFTTHVSVTQTPWNPGTQLVRIGIQGALPAVEDRPPLNLVFLIDTSGSMQNADKLPLLKQSFALMLNQLRPEDQVAIVTYAGSAGQVLAPTAAADRATILAALNRLEAGGSTAGQAGLQQAYRLADTMGQEGDVNRVILATDGDFNVGLSDPEALKDYIARQSDGGTYLSVLGFGRGNLDDATMQALAQNGNGTAAYIDTLNEAQKLLVDQLSGALFPIADDVKIQVEFNPATVAEYRLIGYETRALRREDFNNDAVDAGEIGAGHAVTALYEVTPVGSDARLTEPLRYGSNVASDQTGTGADEIGFLRLRYKAPGSDSSALIEQPIGADAGGQSQAEAGFASAIAGFGQLLRDDSYLGDWGWDEAIALANANRGEDPFGYRAEAVQLMRLAQSLSQ